MYTLEQYRSASLEAQLNLRYAHERLRDMSSKGHICTELFRERQDYMSRCIDDWRALSEGLLTQVQWRQLSPPQGTSSSWGQGRGVQSAAASWSSPVTRGSCTTNSVPPSSVEDTSIKPA